MKHCAARLPTQSTHYLHTLARRRVTCFAQGGSQRSTVRKKCRECAGDEESDDFPEFPAGGETPVDNLPQRYSSASRKQNVRAFIIILYEFMTIAAPEIVAVSSLHYMQR